MTSVSGKTIGTSSSVFLLFRNAASATLVFDLWGVQLEAGSVATAFQTATGTIQGELAACQRYYYRVGGSSNYQVLGYGTARNTNTFDPFVPFPVEMRIAPSSIDYSTLATVLNYSGSATSVSVVAINTASKTFISLAVNSSATPFTANNPVYLTANNSTSAYLGFSAEL
jgi:hypothetical protein